jgi:hypothetical protein
MRGSRGTISPSQPVGDYLEDIPWPETPDAYFGVARRSIGTCLRAIDEVTFCCLMMLWLLGSDKTKLFVWLMD